MKILNETEIRKVASAAGINEKAALRLLGSVRTPVVSPNGSEATYELGLRLSEPGLLTKVGKSVLMDIMASTARAYAQACPIVIGWIGRGDFNPEKPPQEATKAKLLHACRTAGRLRAEAMRNLPNV